MALQVWLPLTKQQSYIENWGICSPIDITNSGAVFNANGKIGNCYTFTDKIIKTTVPANLKNQFSTEATLAMWIKLSSSHSTWAQALTFGTVGTSWENILFGIDLSTNGVPVGNVSNGTNHTNCSFSTAIKDNTWHHLVFTYNNGTLQSYMDGVLKNTVTTTYVPAWSSISVFSIGGNSTETLKNGDAINDVRLYNHALSKREIKEISKGLILHYTLSKPDNTNYFVNSNFYNGTSDWYGVNSSSIRIESKDGRKCITGTKGSTNNICGQTNTRYSYAASSQVTFTISADVYVEETGTFGIGNWISTTEASGWQGMSGQMRSNTPMDLKVGWNHVSATRINGSNQYNGSIVTAFSYTGTTYWMTNVKFEFGNKETPWLPNSTETAIYTFMGYGDTIEYDCSGYQNDGGRFGALSSTSDSPRNSSAIQFSGENTIYIKASSMNIDMNNTTFSIWAKWTAFNTWSRIFDFGEKTSGGGYAFLVANNGSILTVAGRLSGGASLPDTQIQTIATNTWYHIAVTINNAECKTYINGSLVKTFNFNSAMGRASFLLNYLGKSNWSADAAFAGILSDFRVYVTTLTADDILELYNAPINFNKHSTMIQGEFIER